jgi:hypothetical protein
MYYLKEGDGSFKYAAKIQNKYSRSMILQIFWVFTTKYERKILRSGSYMLLFSSVIGLIFWDVFCGFSVSQLLGA